MEETKKNDGRIVLNAKKFRYKKMGESSTVKVGILAYNILVDIANETGLSIKEVAHEIISQSYKQGLIQIKEKDGDEDGENEVVDSK